MEENSSEDVTRIEAHDFERGALKHLKRAIEMGDCVALRWRIENWASRLKASEIQSVADETIEIEKQALSMFEIERAHGEGALLKLDHPEVQEHCNRKNSIYPSSTIQTAKRYRTAMAPEFA